MREIGFKNALILSILVNVVIWFVFTPVIFLKKIDNSFSRIIYFGTLELDSKTLYVKVKYGNIGSLPSFIGKVIRYDEKKVPELNDVLEQRLGKIALELMADNKLPLLGDKLEASKISNMRKDDTEKVIFEKGVFHRFPNGKAYLFEPIFLYPNAYKMVIFSRKAVKTNYD